MNPSLLGKHEYVTKPRCMNMKTSLMSWWETNSSLVETLRVKLIGKGCRHQDTDQAKVTLRKSCWTCQEFRSNHVREQVDEVRPKYPAGASKLYERDNTYDCDSNTLCFWPRRSHPSPRQQNCSAFGKQCNTCGIIGHFARAFKGGITGQQQSNFVNIELGEEAHLQPNMRQQLNMQENSSLTFSSFTEGKRQL